MSKELNLEAEDKSIDTVEKAYNILNNDWCKQVVLYGPPGTSKTYSSTIIAAKLLGYPNNVYEGAKEYLEVDKNKNRYKVVQFHPSYCYEDFVRGISISKANEYTPENKIFAKFCEAANEAKKNAETNKEPVPKYVMVIDEINRAPLATVLGELIYALEKRDHEISTPYDKLNDEDGNSLSGLIVPSNLYIIGTMNTADRSIGSMDYAVRRRFAFVPVLPKAEIIGDTWNSEAMRKFVPILFKYLIQGPDEIKSLFDKSYVQDIDPDDIRIGHTYFLGPGNKDDYDSKLDNIPQDDYEVAQKEMELLNFKLAYQIWPIYQEYIKDDLLKQDPDGNTFVKLIKDAIKEYNDNKAGNEIKEINKWPVKIEFKSNQ